MQKFRAVILLKRACSGIGALSPVQQETQHYKLRHKFKALIRTRRELGRCGGHREQHRTWNENVFF
jgi:hypothetical protein